MPASSRPFMGATPFDGGVTFRVWAPFARSVAVAGTFNQWSTSDAPLTQEGDGYWSTDDARARANDQYKFVIVAGDVSADEVKADAEATYGKVAVRAEIAPRISDFILSMGHSANRSRNGLDRRRMQNGAVLQQA